MARALQPTAPEVRIARPLTWLGAKNKSLMDTLLPSATTVQRLAIALVFVGILVGSSHARFYLPNNPVPFTLQTFGVLLAGGVLGFRWGMFSILTWYFLGMAGVGVFASGANGWAFLSGGISAGYIIGFIASTATVGYLSQRGWNRGRGLWTMLLGGLILYLPALLWLHFFDFGWPAEGKLFEQGMDGFMPGDLLKLMGASIVTAGLWTLADRRKDKST